MNDIYLFMIISLAVLAIADLVVGVSNDAVNFLNSAIGSKAISFRTIMIVASIGIALGAISSSGMMEVARKGIFVPGEFVFDEIMIIFMAVMITDILLLDFFNTLGMPTSTTVSIVFELLGAAVCIALIKIGASDSETISNLGKYINSEQATMIIAGIVLSVIIAFTVGALVQYMSRVILSFNFDEKPKWVAAIFGGVSITAITYFILIKGLKGAAFLTADTAAFIKDNTTLIIAINTVFWSLFSYALIQLFKTNIFKLIIVIGTFALAMAFAGNDLVNFIGVPIAAYNSYDAFTASGADPMQFSMGILADKVPSSPMLLFIAGIIMVITLWFSSKARAVVKTSVDLSRQDEGEERFQPNFLSRLIVRFAIASSRAFGAIMPSSLSQRIDKQFVKPTLTLAERKKNDQPAFDLVRASANLMIASVLISIATSMKLPLSTTYVTFMVAMGTSLADRAWGAESAVYRVAGVLNVIGGWFFTAISAFIAAATMAFLIQLNKEVAVPILLIVAIALLVRNYLKHNKKMKEEKAEDRLQKAESSSIQGVIHESADNIAAVVNRGNRIYTSAIKGLAKQNLSMLKKNKKNIVKLSDEIDDLRDNIFYFIKNLDESSIGASNFYINILSYLQDMTQSLEYISKATHKHVNNNHKKLTFSQIKELKEVDDIFEALFVDTKDAFDSRSFEKIGDVINRKDTILSMITEKIEKQVARTRAEESSPKNTTLYFSLLLETKDLMTATMNLLQEYYESHDSSVVPATIESETEAASAEE